MILPRYHIAPSTIQGAGNGLFLDEPVAAGRIIIAPDGIETTFRHAEIEASAERSMASIEKGRVSTVNVPSI